MTNFIIVKCNNETNPLKNCASEQEIIEFLENVSVYEIQIVDQIKFSIHEKG